MGAPCILDYRPKYTSGRLWLTRSRAVLAQEWKHSAEWACLNLTALRANQEMNSWPSARKGASAFLESATSLCTLKRKSWTKTSAIGLSLSLDSCYLGLQIELGIFGLPTSRMAPRGHDNQQSGTCKCFLSNLWAGVIFRRLPPCGAATAFITSPLGGSGWGGLGCLSFPTGTGPGGHPRSAGQTGWGGPMGYGERLGAGEPCRGGAVRATQPH